MRTIYLECGMGAAGDMLTAALLELLPDRDVFLQKMRAIAPEGVTVHAELCSKQGITGTQMQVLVSGEEEHSHDAHSHHSHPHEHEHHTHEHHSHHHASMDEISEIIAQMAVSDAVKQDALAVYRLLAEAESHAHGCEVSEIHFHEVGTKDAITDIVGVCMLIEMLKPERIVASPVNTGSGHVHCAHGILPVPAPAAAYLLRDILIYSDGTQGELCTPTGAALLRHFVTEFGAMPVMRTDRIGYGFGKKDFQRLNCVRAFWGETDSASEQIAELICNLDDMTGEAIAFAQEELLTAGALDVFTVPVMMKKGRPGCLLTCLCRPEQLDRIRTLIFRHTATLGVRERLCNRYTLDRRTEELKTEYGTVRVKYAAGYDTARSKAEYEDMARIAREHELPLDTVQKMIDREVQ